MQHKHLLTQRTAMDPFSQKLTSILSAPYSDADIRDALLVLDPRLAQNTPDSRRQLRVNVQADVIQTNAVIVREFSKIAEVCLWLTSKLPRRHCTEQRPLSHSHRKRS